MSGNMTFDTRTFRAGLRHKLSLTKRAEADVLNSALGDVALNAIRFVPKAGFGRELLTDGFLMRMVYTIYHPVGGQKKAKELVPGLATFPPKKDSTRVPGYTRAQMKELANRLLVHRRRSRGYIGAGFIRAAQAMGKKLSRKVSAKGNAGKGYGVKAFANRLVALGVNASTGAVIVGPAAVQQAMDLVGRKMLTYAPKQIAKVWK